MEVSFRRGLNTAFGGAGDATTNLSVMVLRSTAFVITAIFLVMAYPAKSQEFSAVILGYLLVYALGWHFRKRLPLLNILLLAIDQLLIFWSIASTGRLHSTAYLLYFVQLMLISPYGGILLSVSTALVSCVTYLFATIAHMATLHDWLVFWFKSSCLLLVGTGCGLWGERIRLHLSLLRREQQEHLQQLRFTEQLSSINQSLLAQLDQEGALQLVLSEGLQLLQADGALAALPDGQAMQVEQAVGTLADWQGIWIEAADAPLGHVLANPGVHNWNSPTTEGWISALAAALSLQGEHSRQGALLFVRSRDRRCFTSHEGQTLQSLASSLSLSMSGARLYSQLQKRNSHLLLLNEIGRSLSANLDMEQLFETMYREVSKVMSIDAFFVALYDARGDHVDIRYLYDGGKRYPPAAMQINNGPTSRAIKSGKPVLWNIDSRNIPGVSFLGDTTRFVQSMLVVPMKIGQRVIGAVSGQSYEVQAYSDEHVQLLETVASQAAVVLSNVRLYERTRELSLTDSMTGLANARRFYQELEHMLSVAAESNGQVSLLMIDSDSLKQINDRYGHPAGDEHIVTLASIIRSQIRTTDLAARYAGDEFMVVLPGASRHAAHIIAERIRESVADHYLTTEGGKVAATVSIGVAVFPDDAKTPEQLFKAADEAMYAAKQGGRNRVSLMRGN